MSIKTDETNKKLSISDYFNLYKKLKNSKNFEKNKKSISWKSKISRTPKIKDFCVKIALLSSFTANGIKEALFVKCHELGVHCDFYVGSYNQYAQEILNKNS